MKNYFKFIIKFFKGKSYILIFLIIISLPLFQSYTLLFNDKLLNEKRNTSAVPVYSKEDGLSSYFQAKEKHFNDTFGFRDYFIRLANYIDVNVFNKSSNSGVIIGKKDYLFSSEELNDYNKDKLLSEADIDKIANNLYTLQENLQSRGMYFVFAIAPNKSTIYPEYMPTLSNNPDSASNLDRLQKKLDELGVNYIDYKELMLKNKDNYQLYYKRDTHWNTIASALAAEELLKAISTPVSINDFSVAPINIKESFRQGDLDDLLGIETPVLEATCDFDIKLPSNKFPKTLVYNDSFYHELLPLLDNFFLQRMDMHNFNAPLHSNFTQFSENAEIVVFEIVERYIPKLINYEFSIYDDDISIVKDLPYTNLPLNILKEKAVAYNNVAVYPQDNYFSYSSLSDIASITWDVPEANLNYILLELENVKKHTRISLYWADKNGNFAEGQSTSLLLQPNKTTYLIGVKSPIAISKLKLDFGKKTNIDLNIKSIKLISSDNITE